MVDASPTPYDITAIPLFAYAPGELAWLIVAVLAIAAVVAFLFLDRKKEAAGKLSATRLAAEELTRLMRESESLTKDSLVRAGLIVRRLLSTTYNTDFVSLTSRQLTETSKALEDPSLDRVIENLTVLGELKYRPDSSEMPDKSVLSPLIDFVNELERRQSGGSA